MSSNPPQMPARGEAWTSLQIVLYPPFIKPLNLLTDLWKQCDCFLCNSIVFYLLRAVVMLSSAIENTHFFSLRRRSTPQNLRRCKQKEGVNPNNLSNPEKAAVIDALRNAYRLKELLDCLHLFKSSYFYQKRVLNRQDKYQSLRQEIRETFAAVNGCYGYRRLHAALKGLGRSVSEKFIRCVMKEERLVVRNIRRRHYDSYLGEISPAAPNLSTGISMRKSQTRSG